MIRVSLGMESERVGVSVTELSPASWMSQWFYNLPQISALRPLRKHQSPNTQ